MSYTYEWHGSSRTPAKSKADTPSRSSRRSGFTNLTHYISYKRSDGEVFTIGDAVRVSPDVPYTHSQFWLDPYGSYGTESRMQYERRVGAPIASTSGSTSTISGSAQQCAASRGTSPRKAGSRRGAKGKVAQREQHEDDWIPDDGLEDAAKFGIIADMYDDEKGKMRIVVHWLARPRLLAYAFGPTLGKEEGLDELDPRELIYAVDPAQAGITSVLLRLSRADDTLQASQIQERIRVLSHAALASEQTHVDSAEQTPTYFIRRALNTRAEEGESWLYDIDWQEVIETCISTGDWELGTSMEDVKIGKTASNKKQKTTLVSKGKSSSKRGTAALREQHESPSRRKQGKRSASVASSTAGSSRAASPATSSESEQEEEAEVDLRSDHDYSDSEEDDEDDVPDKGEMAEDSDKEPESDSDFDVFGPQSSARKRKAAGLSHTSPAKRGRPSLLLKPSAAMLRKAAERKERQARRVAERKARMLKPRLPLVQQRHLGMSENATPFEKARSVLHVGCTPDYLPCRDNEYAEIEAYLEDAIDEGIGSCIYIAGVPGTGKTATVRSVVSALQTRADNGEIKGFRFLEVNGMKITDPPQAFTILWEFISGVRCPPKQALAALEAHFKTPNPGRDTCVVLMDELDQLVTKKQEVIYNFFNWPNQSHSRLIVLAVANTMDLPERELSNKINSRLGSNRINFTPYDKNQLIEILTARLEGLDGVFAQNAIGLVASKVAGVTGDARRALDICRRAVETVEAENHGTGVSRLVTALDIVEVHKGMTSSGLMLFVKRAGLHQRIMLLALSRAIRKVGVADEVEFGDVVRWHMDFCRQTAISPLPTHAQLFSILQSLADLRLVTTEGARLDYYQRVQANVRNDELELVLRKEQQFMHYLR